MALPPGVMCAATSLLARLASHSNAGCSSSAVAITYVLGQQLRGQAGFTKAGGSKGTTVSKKKSSSVGPANEENPRVKAMISMLQPPERKELPPLTPEEDAAAQQLKQGRVAEKHAWIRDMTIKLKLQQEALRALPERLRLLAEQQDHTPFPMNRNFLFDTPPESYRDPVGKIVAAGRGGGPAAATATAAGATAGGKQMVAGKHGGK